jgi:Fe-S-cluster-containing hydrogenase component 2
MKIQVEAGLCRDCEACALACSVLHEGESNPLLSRVLVKKDMANFQFSIVICEHCQLDGRTPDCVQACSVDAIRLDERGVVMIYQDECIQCAACAEACPYEAIFYNENTNQYFKCDLCADQKDGPACVEICPVEALTIRLEAVPGGSV